MTEEYARLTFYENWEGGTPKGSLNFCNGAFLVRFNDGTRKTFNPMYYGNKAKKLAEKWRFETALKKGLVYNRYRYVLDTLEGEYIEVKLQDDHIAKIDPQDLHLLRNCIWSAKKMHSTFYMEHSGKKSRNIPSQRFHRLIKRKWPIVDHINRDGLDNRRINLRNGGGNINNRNQKKRHDNASGKTGVHFCTYDQLWVVQYPCDGKRRKKTFSISKYGNEKSKQLAIKFRKKIDKQYKITNGY